MRKNQMKWGLVMLFSLSLIQPAFAVSGAPVANSVQQSTVKEIVTLPQLEYRMSALAPVISEQTMNYHYGKHFKAYVDQLNALVQGTDYETMTLEEIIRKAPAGAVFNNAGQVLNHALYFEQFAPSESTAGHQPQGALKEAIDRSFGDFATFRKQMSEAAVKLFGSGWAWLVQTDDGSLKIEQYYNADNPVKHGQQPLMCIDVWEHAYYLDYQNGRASYVQKIWDIIDWNVVAGRMKK